jgi:ribonuclease Z
VVLQDGRVLKNEQLTQDPPTPKRYAYCSDSAYFPEIIPLIEGADCLYHEATFLKDKMSLASKTGHSTAAQAASIAKQAGVKQLILGHFSNRYKEKEAFKKEADEIFNNTLLAEDGKVFTID